MNLYNINRFFKWIRRNKSETKTTYNMSRYVWLIDEGHGDMVDGHYTTPSEKSKQYKFDPPPDGEPLQIYEGVINRAIGRKLKAMLALAKIDHFSISPGFEDMPLRERVDTADRLYHQHKNDSGKYCIYVSLHSNKITKEIEGASRTATGYMVFTSRGQTKSDLVANIFIERYKKDAELWPMRKEFSDGDADFEADFYVLRKTDCPAILLENLFYDEVEQARYLASEQGQDRIATVIFNAIEDVEEAKPF